MTFRLRPIAVACALAVSVVYVRGSQRAGRLTQDLTYDDVTYVTDAAGRLQEAAARGPGAFLKTFVHRPPHSPVSTALALVGLTAFGFTDSAVYWANLLIPVATVLLLVHLFRESPPWAAALVVGVYLTSPLAERTVTEFRPDLLLAMCTAASVFAVLRGALRGRPGEVTLGGALLGLALLAKPSFFPHTLVMACAAGALLLVFRCLGEPLVPRRTLARAALLGLAIALPHYLLDARSIVDYVWVNTGGAEGHLWSFPKEKGFWTVLYQFTLDPGSNPFRFAGYDLHLHLAVVVLGIAGHAARRDRRGVLLLTGLAAAATVSVLVVTLGRMDNEFFASTFQCLLALASFSVIAELLPAALPRPAAAALAAGVAALHVGAVLETPAHPWDPPPDARPGASWNDRVAQAIRADLQARDIPEDRDRRVVVFVTAAAALNGKSLLWSCQKAGLPAEVFDMHRSDSEEALATAALAADYVVVPNPSRAAVLAWLPAAHLQPALLSRFLASKELVRVAAGSAEDPDRYFVFANVSRLAGRGRS